MNNFANDADFDEISLDMDSDCEDKVGSDTAVSGINQPESVVNFNVSAENACHETFTDKVQYLSENTFSEDDVEDCSSMLNFNKGITSYLLQLKSHITSALEKCERKLIRVESALQKHTCGGDRKFLIYNVGMPYFKDKHYFFAPNNEDDVSKEKRGELQVRNLPRVTLWTTKDRNIFLKAIETEAGVDSEKREMDDSKLKVEQDGEMQHKDVVVLSDDARRMIGPLGEKEFDWLKISSIHFEDKHSPLDCRVMWNVFLHPDINKNCWKRPEDNKLKEIAKKCKLQNWDKIATELGRKRTAYQCFIRYNTKRKLPKAKNCIWEKKEDERLLKLVDIFQIGDFIPWGEIASWMENRTKQQVYFRWTYSLAPSLVKGRFTKAEDNLLQDAVVKYGTNFCKISAALLPNRSTIQLQSRYNTLIFKKVANRNVWTYQEDSKLLKLFQRFGSNWSKIAEAFSFKTRTQLRHRHASLQKSIHKGMSLLDLHKNHLNDTNNGTQGVEYNENEIDSELIEYFWRDYSTKRSACKATRKFHSMEELRFQTKNLYSILRLLNAKLSIPDDYSNVELNTELLRSFKEYIRMKDDRKRYVEGVKKCRSHMFGATYEHEQSSPFLSLPLNETRSKLPSHRLINCNLNRRESFLLQPSSEFTTPDFVISYIGGNEEELQFQKFARLLQFDSSSAKQDTIRTEFSYLQNNHKDDDDLSLTSFPTSDNNSETRECESYSMESQNRAIITNSVPFPDRLIFSIENLQTISCNKLFKVEASYATLLAFYHLVHLKRFKEKKYTKPDDSFHATSTFEKASGLLEMRLEQLFKYPIGLSKTVLPQVYAIDTLSSHNATAAKRKASRSPTVLTKCESKKLRLLNQQKKDVR